MRASRCGPMASCSCALTAGGKCALHIAADHVNTMGMGMGVGMGMGTGMGMGMGMGTGLGMSMAMAIRVRSSDRVCYSKEHSRIC